MTAVNIPLFRICTKCGQEKPATTEYFHKHSGNKYGLDPDCKLCHAEDGARRYYDNREEYLSRHKARSLAIKIEVMTHYGNGECKCVMCGYDIIAALTLDHIDDDGYKEAKSGKSLYLYLRKHSYPSGYQTLCMNCQYVKRDANGNGSRVGLRENSRWSGSDWFNNE